jgi:hypothetical protein
MTSTAITVQQSNAHEMKSAPGANLDAEVIVDHKPNTIVPKHYHIEDNTFTNPVVAIKSPPLKDQFRIYTEIMLARQFIPNEVQLPLAVPNWQAINQPDPYNVQVFFHYLKNANLI